MAVRSVDASVAGGGGVPSREGWLESALRSFGVTSDSKREEFRFCFGKFMDVYAFCEAICDRLNVRQCTESLFRNIVLEGKRLTEKDGSLKAVSLVLSCGIEMLSRGSFDSLEEFWIEVEDFISRIPRIIEGREDDSDAMQKEVEQQLEACSIEMREREMEVQELELRVSALRGQLQDIQRHMNEEFAKLRRERGSSSKKRSNERIRKCREEQAIINRECREAERLLQKCQVEQRARKLRCLSIRLDKK